MTSLDNPLDFVLKVKLSQPQSNFDVRITLRDGNCGDASQVTKSAAWGKIVCICCRCVNNCMSTHLNANAIVSIDSYTNANANAIFQKSIQMQMQRFLGSHSNANVLVTHLQINFN